MTQTDGRPELPRVAVLGSCLTRDNFNSRFNPDHRSWFTLGAMANQMSLISLMSQPYDTPWEPTREMSDYDRWNVGQEFSKGFLTDVVESAPDYLVLDLFGDIHFGVVRVDDSDLYITDNRWKVHTTDWYTRMTAEGRLTRLNVFDHTDEYLTLWRDAVERLASHLSEHLPNATVVINRGRNTDSLWLKDQPRPVSLVKSRKHQRFDVARSNELWAQMDDVQTELLGAETIDLTSIDFGTYREHPWGPNEVHLHPEYYRLFMAQLHRIHVARTSPPEVAERLARIDEAWWFEVGAQQQRFEALSNRLDARNRQVARQTKQITHLQERVRLLEEGSTQSTRRALGRVARRLIRR